MLAVLLSQPLGRPGSSPKLLDRRSEGCVLLGHKVAAFGKPANHLTNC
jgi:hypothetical protein